MGVFVVEHPLQPGHHIGHTAHAMIIRHLDIEQVDIWRDAHIFAARLRPVAADKASHMGAMPKIVVHG